MEKTAKQRLGSGVALLFLCPALVAALSGCNRSCDDDFSTLSTRDDCGTSRSGSTTGRVGGGGGGVGAGQVGARSGGFGSFGRSFSGGG